MRTRSQATAGLDVEQHDEMLAERRAHALREDAAAAERDHVARAGAGQQLAHELLLGGAERRLAAELELAGDRMTEALLQQPVAVERPRLRAPRPARPRRSTCRRP